MLWWHRLSLRFSRHLTRNKPIRLKSYLERINYAGAIEPNITTLAALHEAHVCSVPFENLDIQLARPVSIGIEAAFEKIVINSRGGWCYEQNGLFGWVLTEIGFSVTRIAASVMRQKTGAACSADHLCLLVKSPDDNREHLVDVGFGGSLFRPIELKQAQYEQTPFRLGLERLDDQYWRYWEDLGKGKFSFDFCEEPACEALLARKSSALQSEPDSNFVLNLVAQKRSRNQHRVLRGRVYSVTKQSGIDSEIVASPEAMVSLLENEFGLMVPEVASLWPKITARHKVLFDRR